MNSKYTSFSPIQQRPLKLNFMNQKSEQIGKLTEKNGMLEFEGNANESAEIFFNYVCKLHSSELKKFGTKIAEMQAELDKARELLDKSQIAINSKSGGSYEAELLIDIDAFLAKDK